MSFFIPIQFHPFIPHLPYLLWKHHPDSSGCCCTSTLFSFLPLLVMLLFFDSGVFEQGMVVFSEIIENKRRMGTREEEKNERTDTKGYRNIVNLCSSLFFTVILDRQTDRQTTTGHPFPSFKETTLGSLKSNVRYNRTCVVCADQVRTRRTTKGRSKQMRKKERRRKQHSVTQQERR